MKQLDAGRLGRIIRSNGFKKLYDHMDAANDRFRDLPQEQKMFALAYIISGEVEVDEVLDEIGGSLYYRDIPTIQEFLTPKYVGPVAHYYVNPGAWRRDLEHIFSPTSNVREWVLTGAIGTAKSSNSCLAHFYNLFRITSLRYPQLTLGSDAGKEMVLQLMTVTKYKSIETLLLRFQSLLTECPFFQRVRSEVEMEEVMYEYGGRITPWWLQKEKIIFPNHIRVDTGSQGIHAIGSDLFGATLDEVDHRPGKGSIQSVEAAFDLYSNLFERIRSRFGESRYTLMTLVSSIGYETGVMVKYIRDIEKQKDTRRYLSQYSIWDIKTPNYDRDKVFYVLRGNQRHASRMLDADETEAHRNKSFVRPSGCEVISVPNMYLSEFRFNVERALRNLAGLYSVRDEKPFDELDHCVDRNLCPVIDLLAPLGASVPLLEQLPKEVVSRTPIGLRLRRYPTTLRYSHWDLADTGKAGFTVVHKELGPGGKILYVVDFCARIQSPDRISFEKLGEFMLGLRDSLGITFHSMTSDSYQNVSLQQLGQTRRIAKVVKNLSVDRTVIPYNTLAGVVSEDSLRIGEMRGLRDELDSIHYDKGKPFTQGKGRKDMADSLCGAVFNAVSNVSDVPINPYYRSDAELTDPARLIPTDFAPSWGQVRRA